MAIALSHGGSNIYSAPEPSREILIGTKDGVTTLARDVTGSSWHVARRSLGGRFISSIVIEPTTGTIFAGAFFGTVYASTDGGATWEERSQGMTQSDVFSLACVQANGRPRLFAGTQPAHLFVSDDLGKSWTELPALRSVPSVDEWSFPAPPHVAHTKFITFDPHDPSTIYACIEQGALLKSADNGRSFHEINTVGFFNDQNRKMEDFYDVHKAVVDPRNPNRIVASGGAGIYITADSGDTWERRMSPDWAPDVYPDGLVMRPSKPDTIVVTAAEHNPSKWATYGTPPVAGGKVFRTLDGGETWETLAGGLPSYIRHEFGALCLEDWGDSFSLFGATTDGEVYASDDGGDHWSLIAQGLPAVSKKGHERILTPA